ncbi:uncharacterized protein MONBRDRAFT_3444, partial [Monosiga brevicollis MX1]
GWTPLHLACRSGHTKVAGLLLELNVNVNCYSQFGETPLHMASQGGHCSVIDLLLQRKADVEATDRVRETPLHWACQHARNAETIELLLRNHANVDQENK